MGDIDGVYEDPEEITDPIESDAIESVEELFKSNKANVFYGRQVEVLFEDKYFHWITNRALRILTDRKIIIRGVQRMKWGGTITLYWHNSFRYYKREASKIIKIVEAYSAEDVSFSIGQYCELLVLEGFAKFQFILNGRSVNEYNGKKYESSNHNLDMILEKDGISYGIEVKNTLGYIDKREFELKIDLCNHLGIKPVFVARMLPKSWIHKLNQEGGFGLILKYQLFPQYLRGIVELMKNNLHLPVDCPKSLLEGTIKRFENWHRKNVN